jgi:hypothetical protein
LKAVYLELEVKSMTQRTTAVEVWHQLCDILQMDS